MSTEPLSDDMSNWPSDPFALLGVQPGAADAEIKRAYTRLVRRFKPEHHPDQFRRIREAYEVCQERAAWYRPDPEEYSPPPPPPARPASPPPLARRQPVIDPEVPPSDVPPTEPVVDPYVEPAPAGDPVEELWEVAIDGREAEAYAELARLHAAGYDSHTLPLRLYWLLAVNPSLDTRSRHHWLADALSRSGFRGPAVELYRRELETDPVATLDDPIAEGRYFRALTGGAPTSATLGVLRWRVAAAGRLGWTARIRADLTAVRDSLVMSDEAGWLGLLVLAGGWVAWADSLEFDHFLKSELASLTHLQLSQASLFDRVEEIEQVSKDVEWGRYRTLPEDVLTLAKVSFADPSYARPAEVEAAAVALRKWGRSVLSQLHTTFVKRPGHLQLLGREFDNYLRARGLSTTPDIPPDRLRGLARRLKVLMPLDYSPLRLELLDLLADAVVHPLEFAEALSADPKRAYRQLAAEVRDDLPLLVAWLGLRVVSG